MAWAQNFRPTPTQQARADLARELDIALHGHATFSGHVTESRWLGFLDEVRGITRPDTVSVAERFVRTLRRTGASADVVAAAERIRDEQVARQADQAGSGR